MIPNYDHVRVAFLSGGSVTDVNMLVNNTDIYGIRQLPYGGFMFVQVTTNDTDMGYYSDVSVRNKDGTNIQTFELPQGDLGDFAIFPNNTVWIGSRETANLTVYFISLPKLLPEGELIFIII